MGEPMNSNPLAFSSSAYPIIERGHNLFRFSSAIKSLIKDGESSTRVDRIQMQPAPGRYDILVRHSTQGHFCGYVKVNEAFWDGLPFAHRRRTRDLVRERTGLQVSYAGYNNAIITWCDFSSRGSLSIPTRINQMGPDFFLGFSLHAVIQGGFLVEPAPALAKLIEFSEAIEELCNDPVV